MEQQDHRSVLWTSLPIEDVQTINLGGAVEGWWYCGRVRILGRACGTGERRQCGQGTSGEPEFKRRFHHWPDITKRSVIVKDGLNSEPATPVRTGSSGGRAYAKPSLSPTKR